MRYGFKRHPSSGIFQAWHGDDRVSLHTRDARTAEIRFAMWLTKATAAAEALALWADIIEQDAADAVARLAELRAVTPDPNEPELVTTARLKRIDALARVTSEARQRVDLLRRKAAVRAGAAPRAVVRPVRLRPRLPDDPHDFGRIYPRSRR